MSTRDDFKKDIEKGIQRSIDERPEKRSKYEASFHGEDPPKPLEVTVSFTPDSNVPGIYSAKSDNLFLKLTDHVAPSGVHYRDVGIDAPESVHAEGWLDVIINTVPLLLSWNGHGDHPDTVNWETVITPDEVSKLLNR